MNSVFRLINTKEIFFQFLAVGFCPKNLAFAQGDSISLQLWILTMFLALQTDTDLYLLHSLGGYKNFIVFRRIQTCWFDVDCGFVHSAIAPIKLGYIRESGTTLSNDVKCNSRAWKSRLNLVFAALRWHSFCEELKFDVFVADIRLILAIYLQQSSCMPALCI